MTRLDRVAGIASLALLLSAAACSKTDQPSSDLPDGAVTTPTPDGAVTAQCPELPQPDGALPYPVPFSGVPQDAGCNGGGTCGLLVNPCLNDLLVYDDWQCTCASGHLTCVLAAADPVSFLDGGCAYPPGYPGAP